MNQVYAERCWEIDDLGSFKNTPQHTGEKCPWYDAAFLAATFGRHFDDAKDALKEMQSQASDLQNIPATQKVLRKSSIRALYSSICGSLEPSHQRDEQDYTRVTMIACYSLEEKVIQFVQAREEIKEYSKETYSWLWELKNRWHDAVVSSLPDMPRSPHEFIHLLRDSGSSTHIPFWALSERNAGEASFFVCRLVFRPHVGRCGVAAASIC